MADPVTHLSSLLRRPTMLGRARTAACVALFLSATAAAYTVSVSDEDYSRQTCSGMWANEQTFINGTHIPLLSASVV
jgi:hypothetical protein